MLKNERRKLNYLHCNAGTKYSFSVVVWNLVGCILLIHFYSIVNQKYRWGEIQAQSNIVSVNRELERVDKEIFQFPARKRRPRHARSWRQKGRRTSILDELMDNNSKTSRIWLDTDGNPFQAHGGGILYVESSGMFYWYGENKDGVTCHAYRRGCAWVSLTYEIGWAPNKALVHAAESIMGPWETLGNPCVGGNQIFQATTFFAQGTFVLPIPGIPGSFIFMCDRWNLAELRDSRYVWLPLTVGGAADKPLEHSFGFSL